MKFKYPEMVEKSLEDTAGYFVTCSSMWYVLKSVNDGLGLGDFQDNPILMDDFKMLVQLCLIDYHLDTTYKINLAGKRFLKKYKKYQIPRKAYP